MRLASCSLSLPTKHARGRWKQNSKQRSGTLRVMDSCSSSGWPSSCFSLLRSCWVVCWAVGVMDMGVGAGRGLSGGEALAARAEENTSERQSQMRICDVVFCMKKKNTYKKTRQLIKL